ncbi:hypothetical protein Nepgr_031437 [Nepenthes gracilis]|uniref:Uncharacterized protein n=1 Tax=Nepenthes gracilis TaxID=150966 RepID=A0AAD3Y729_NEPGR|nr:hypothetical protein Nepgr_031437 [Nepenthes gracilis]
MGARVVCILGCPKDLQLSKLVLSPKCRRSAHRACYWRCSKAVEEDYEDADFVVVDCNLRHHEGIPGAVKGGKRCSGANDLGYNAIFKGSWRWSGAKGQLLPIGNVYISSWRY